MFFSPTYSPALLADMNECQLDIHSCVDNQRCDNTIGSFSCIRTSGCGTGYTLNSQLGICEGKALTERRAWLVCQDKKHFVIHFQYFI